MANTILVATTNQGKIRELHRLLEVEAEMVQLVGLDDVGPVPEVVEDEPTFAGNARKKATAYAAATGYWTISDDSGLVIDALDGLPGVRSARFSGVRDPDRRVVDRANIRKVLEMMQAVPEAERAARFVCCVCLADPEKVLLETEGLVEGKITLDPLGEKGFGYDPIFWVPSLSRTMAQLDSGEKNAISHRGNAIRKLKPRLEPLLRV